MLKGAVGGGGGGGGGGVAQKYIPEENFIV